MSAFLIHPTLRNCIEAYLFYVHALRIPCRVTSSVTEFLYVCMKIAYFYMAFDNLGANFQVFLLHAFIIHFRI